MRSLRTTDENQGLGLGIGWILRGFRRGDRSRFTLRGPQTAAVRSVLTGAARKTAVFRAAVVAAGAGRRGCRGALTALGFGWARVEDESKCRRQGLVVCRATLPFEGFCDARPGVTLAPTFFFGVAACQSRTIRV